MWTNSRRIFSGTFKFMVFHLWIAEPDWSFCSTESTHFLNGIKIIPSWIAYVAFHHGIILMPTTLANCTSGIILMPTRLKLCSTESTQFLNGIKIMPSWIVCVVFHHGIILIPTTTLTMAIWHYSNANFGIKIIPCWNATKFSFGIILIPWCNSGQFKSFLYNVENLWQKSLEKLISEFIYTSNRKWPIFGATRCGFISQKSSNLHYLFVNLSCFDQFLAHHMHLVARLSKGTKTANEIFSSAGISRPSIFLFCSMKIPMPY